jgi:chromosome segregation protein
LQGLWSRIHIEPGWENALEAALRERLGALEVSRLDMVRGLWLAKTMRRRPSWPSTARRWRVPEPRALPRLADLLRLNDAGQKALLTDWLQGCYTAQTWTRPWPARASCSPARSSYVPSGHAVTRHSVSFYAQDSEQAGLLARAQEIENLEKELRAQALIADESRTALVRAEAAYADARSAWWPPAASHRGPKPRPRAAGGNLRLTQLAEQTRARSEQIRRRPGRGRGPAGRPAGAPRHRRGRFEELDMQLADSQERHAQLDER